MAETGVSISTSPLNGTVSSLPFSNDIPPRMNTYESICSCASATVARSTLPL
jgi:hypothetical protein